MSLFVIFEKADFVFSVEHVSVIYIMARPVSDFCAWHEKDRFRFARRRGKSDHCKYCTSFHHSLARNPFCSNMKVATIILSTLLYATSSCSRSVALSSEQNSSRRNVLQKFALTSSAFVLGGSLNLDSLHDDGCACRTCLKIGIRHVNAYEKRNVGGDNPSAATYAMNVQALKTNNRLEAQGYKLQTEDEQTAEAKSFLSSYSYNADVSSGNSKSKDKKGSNSKK